MSRDWAATNRTGSGARPTEAPALTRELVLPRADALTHRSENVQIPEPSQRPERARQRARQLGGAKLPSRTRTIGEVHA